MCSGLHGWGAFCRIRWTSGGFIWCSLGLASLHTVLSRMLCPVEEPRPQLHKFANKLTLNFQEQRSCSRYCRSWFLTHGNKGHQQILDMRGIQEHLTLCLASQWEPDGCLISSLQIISPRFYPRKRHSATLITKAHVIPVALKFLPLPLTWYHKEPRCDLIPESVLDLNGGTACRGCIGS